MTIVGGLERSFTGTSYQCSPEQVSYYLRETSYGLKIFHMNIRSIGNSSDFNHLILILLLHRIKVQFDVIVFSECWLLKCPNLPTLPGFVTLVSDHSSQNYGVVIYFRHDMQFLTENTFS